MMGPTLPSLFLLGAEGRFWRQTQPTSRKPYHPNLKTPLDQYHSSTLFLEPTDIMDPRKHSSHRHGGPTICGPRVSLREVEICSARPFGARSRAPRLRSPSVTAGHGIKSAPPCLAALRWIGSCFFLCPCAFVSASSHHHPPPRRTQLPARNSGGHTQRGRSVGRGRALGMGLSGRGRVVVAAGASL
jgi:hypothetical protein